MDRFLDVFCNSEKISVINSFVVSDEHRIP